MESRSNYEDAARLVATREAVAWTHKQAQRELRAVKVKQKVSGGLRSPSGSQSYRRISSFISTMRKMKPQVVHELKSVIEGTPFVLFQT